jgi:predicted ribosomally synthesized peptide with SipW-like signal peptide
MKKSASKKTLIASAAALSLSALLFAGTTYAWFTDSASSDTSVIQSGNLDIQFQVWTAEGWKDIDKDTNVFEAANGKTSLWEPGHAETVYLRIKNAGSLSLKYELLLNAKANVFESVNKESTSLADYVEYGYEVIENVDEEKDFSTYVYTSTQRADAISNLTDTDVEWTSGSTYSGKASVYQNDLMKKSSVDYLAFTAYMPETVTNDANWKNIEGNSTPQLSCSFLLNAAQVSDEKDSFGNDYDETAPYDVLAQYISQGYTTFSDGQIKTADIATPLILTGDATIGGETGGADDFWAIIMGLPVSNDSNLEGNLIVELNGYTLNATSSFDIKNETEDTVVSLSNGTYSIGDVSYGQMHVQPVPGKHADVTMTNMVFESSTPNTNSDADYAELMKVIEYAPDNGCTGTLVFKNCVFNQTYLDLSGMNGDSTIEVVFENCTFNIKGATSPVRVGNFVQGTIKFVNSTINATNDDGEELTIVDFYNNNENITVSIE